MKISFHGAARTVTGSKHLITTDDGQKILLDCGMYQGLGSETGSLNADFGFDAASVHAVILSHAHIDHSGLLPKLVKDGFAGKIYCTPATSELTDILLQDSAMIQEHERGHHHGHGGEALYTCADVAETVSRFETVVYEEVFSPAAGVEVRFFNAGHLIGSAAVHLTFTENNNITTLLFSGDVGRYRSTLLQPPVEFPPADYIILESTYGNKLHAPVFNAVDPIYKQIKKTCLEKKGKLIIPAFSVGRTQEVLYALNQLELEHRLPEVNYFVDSPLGKKATEVIKHYMEQFNDRLQEILKSDDDPFDFAGLQYIDSPEDSKRLETSAEPCVVISASGTADAGRVKHHLQSNLPNPDNTVLFVGHCQPESLGGRLLRGDKTVEIFGETCNVAAEIDTLTSMSAHGDSTDLIKFISVMEPREVKGIFLVHGEYECQQQFADKLALRGYAHVTIPAPHESVELKSGSASEAA